jgi:hypothetical protein
VVVVDEVAMKWSWWWWRRRCGGDGGGDKMKMVVEIVGSYCK